MKKKEINLSVIIRILEAVIIVDLIAGIISLFLPWYKVVLKEDVLYSVFGVLGKSFTQSFILFFLLIIFIIIELILIFYIEFKKRKLFKLFSINSLVLGILILLVSCSAYLKTINIQYGFVIFVISGIVMPIGSLILFFTVKKEK